jgi:spore maturation protein A
MSIVWVVLLAGSLAAAAVNGRMNALTASIATSAQSAVTLSLGLVGVMSLWLGLMRVAEEAGIVALLARAARPILQLLFPEIPEGHPAMGAMVMNVAANLLGLGNAATPFGIEAMRRLDELNPHRGTASDAQALFCALNTASLQIIPATVIALRAGAGARNPADVIGPVIVASACAAAVAVAAAKLLASWYPLPRPPDVVPGERP